tara:strand:+ start:138734 stop:139114 length:381 start_codon:yes stop_codon:yes gene_type:complete
MKLLFHLLTIFPLLGFAQVGSTCQGRIDGEYICLNEDFEGWQMTIQDSLMVQTNKEYELSIYSDLEWISECEFSSTIVKVKGPPQAGLIGSTTKVTVTRLNPRSMVIETNSEGELKEWRYSKKLEP